ncbi:glycosyltransferase family 2 protein [Algiphilus aromaticivorans]|uniref:glycosyltransferase family 2 protein n=1 Tax=Algiphilus aromaticivorans TaxID=382454 RepID=UPI0018DEB7F5|nr:glycosyltransferase family 2 protein [Algiphilus aromaticivorans]
MSLAESVVDVTVLIVAYRSRRTLPKALAALEHQTVSPRSVRILENGSPEGEGVEGAQVPAGYELLESPVNLGFAGGNNRLAEDASGEWLLLMNPDCYPEPDWLERLMQAAAAYPWASLFGSTQYADGGEGHLDGLGDVYHHSGFFYRGGYGRVLPPPTDGEVFSPCGAAMMVRRSLFEGLGGFDADYFCYGEDVDLCFRARLLGHRAVQVAGAVVVHEGSASSSRYSDFAVYHGVRNRAWTFFKNMPWLLLLFSLPMHAALTLAHGLVCARRGQGRLYLRALRDACRAWRNVRAKRRRILSGRRVALGTLARAMSWRPLDPIRRRPVIREIPAGE